jgi:hypothetical protein
MRMRGVSRITLQGHVTKGKPFQNVIAGSPLQQSPALAVARPSNLWLHYFFEAGVRISQQKENGRPTGNPVAQLEKWPSG